jgi:lipoprotein-anchoring transpeptidase ErfK/SrfK
MRRTIPLTIAFVLALAAPSGAQEPRIAAGVSAAGVDLSGLTLAEATGRLHTLEGPALGRPLSAHVAGRKFAVVPARLKLVFDGAKTARRAYNAGIAPHTGPVDVPLHITYDKRRVARYARGVASTVARAPRDATVRIALRHITRVPSSDGRALNAKALAAAVGKVLSDPRRQRVLHPPLRVLKPKVTTAGVARAYGTVITIDRGAFTLRLFKRLRHAKTYRVAVGQPAYPTPTGRFSITSKAVNPAWTAPDQPWAGAYRNEAVAGGSAENPLKARWMGIANGVGIHGTGIPESIGTAASHGCIRMTVPDVIDLYPRVPVGTPVLIGG